MRLASPTRLVSPSTSAPPPLRHRIARHLKIADTGQSSSKTSRHQSTRDDYGTLGLGEIQQIVAAKTNRCCIGLSAQESQMLFLQVMNRMPTHEQQYDAFISHASEDKETLVRPLAGALKACGATIWYDEDTLQIGDSLRSAIDAGLRNSAHGIIIISPAFFAKPWPKWELDGLLKKHLTGQSKVLLPVWHNVTANDVEQYSFSLSNIVALNSSQGPARLAEGLARVIAPASALKARVQALPEDVKESIRQALLRGRYTYYSFFVKQAPLDEVIYQVVTNKNCYGFLRYFHQRGHDFAYHPDSKGGQNAIADYNLDEMYEQFSDTATTVLSKYRLYNL